MDPTSMFTLKPIGHMKSLFHFKNGTPRQSSLCKNARGILTIEKSIFDNPDHSLDGLQDYSHAWILFLFHKNNNEYKKAKVKPPRLNGRKVGVFSTRSPYRPNNVGLSLVKIDKIDGASIHLSGIDILDGTPVIDIKPYIPDYDKPQMETDSLCSFPLSSSFPLQNNTGDICDTDSMCEIQSSHDCDRDTGKICHDVQKSNIASSASESVTLSPESKCDFKEPAVFMNLTTHENIEEGLYSNNLNSITPSVKSFEDVTKEDDCEQDDFVLDSLVDDVISRAASDVLLTDSLTTNTKPSGMEEEIGTKVSCNLSSTTTIPHNCLSGETTLESSKSPSNSATTAPWLASPPVTKVQVVFSSEALQQLQEFHSSAVDTRFKTELLSDPEDAKNAITSILHEEPRSVYRRKKCENTVYFFVIDKIHVACWFDRDAVTVLRIKPVADVPLIQQKLINFKKSDYTIEEHEMNNSSQ